MAYIAIFIIAIISAGYSFLTQTESAAAASSVNSALAYVDYMRNALAYYRELYPDYVGEVTLKQLSLPANYHLAERRDSRIYVDDKGFYIAFSSSSPELASALADKYAAATGLGAHVWNLAYYHVGYKGDGNCLIALRNYPEENRAGHCARPLPAAVASGALVVTDRDSE
ncbi:type IV pilus biogenesis protein PilM [Erwinia sp. HR93]|uniref:type IV pilus biogenesis protein PilM n=1 Tax=Erwinia sp. HR93 TaxID=3094840 RepID=UPI002ADEEF45|nr:type IV pilus biogenesis protein PilM [Erwinia sp. HR93]MEA1063814.1 type IV pilus biogenesis protein PilM [Erwinia sp. HR93]